MTAAEFETWWDEYERNPWGEFRESAHNAHIVQTIKNFAGKTLKDNASLSDCMLEFDADKQAQEVEPDPIAHFSKFK